MESRNEDCSESCIGRAAKAAAITAGPEPMKIRRIDLFPARYPMTGHFEFFTGPHGSLGRASIFVKVTAEDGTVGWGQSVPITKWSCGTLEAVTVALRDLIAPVDSIPAK